MAPPFIQNIRQRGLPPEPDHGNPFEIATQKWALLHEYATKVAEVARETDDTNKMLQAENDALHRENARLSEQVDKIARELRATSAFAESMRTRMKAITEQITAAIHDGMEHAQHAMKEPARKVPEVGAVERELARSMQQAEPQHRPRERLPENKMANG